MKTMKTIIIAAGLLALSTGAQAEWARLGSNSNGTGYLWYPVEQDYPYAYPFLGSELNQSVTAPGLSHRVSSILSEMTVDCRDGRAMSRRVRLYAGFGLTGARTRIKWIVVSNGLKVVVGRWYRYAQFPSLIRKAIRLSCE